MQRHTPEDRTIKYTNEKGKVIRISDGQQEAHIRYYFQDQKSSFLGWIDA